MPPDDPPPFEDLYDPDVLARIDAVLAEAAGDRSTIGHSDDDDESGELIQVDFDPDAGPDPDAEPIAADVPHEGTSGASRAPVSIDGKLAQWARGTIAGAFLYGTGRAIEDLFKADPEIAEIQEDPGFGTEDTRPVRLVLVPGAPKQSKAFVRPWLFARLRADASEGPGPHPEAEPPTG